MDSDRDLFLALIHGGCDHPAEKFYGLLTDEDLYPDSSVHDSVDAVQRTTRHAGDTLRDADNLVAEMRGYMQLYNAARYNNPAQFMIDMARHRMFSKEAAAKARKN